MRHIHSLAVEALASLIAQKQPEASKGEQNAEAEGVEVQIGQAVPEAQGSSNEQDCGKHSGRLGFVSSERLGQGLNLGCPRLGDVSEPEFLGSRALDACGVGYLKNPPTGKPLQLGAERLYGSDLLIHTRIVIRFWIGIK